MQRQHNNEYDYLLENWDRSVENFQKAAVMVFGIDRNSVVYHLIESSVDTMEKLSEWIRFFNGDFDAFEETTTRFLAHSPV